MSKRIDDGGPAFPQITDALHGGMSLRDWFAGQALNGLCADPEANRTFRDPDDFATASYSMADAMLAARKAGGGA